MPHAPQLRVGLLIFVPSGGLSAVGARLAAPALDFHPRCGRLPTQLIYFGKSSAAFRLKKLYGRNSNSCHAVGITGQSSACGTW